MGNEENLKKGAAHRFGSGEEAARAGSRGGKKSAETRRRRKAMKAVLSELLTLPPNSSEAQAALRGLSDLLGEEADNQTAVLAGLMKQAMTGDVKAVQEIRNILGESRDTAPEAKERKARTEHTQVSTAVLKARASMDEEEQPEDDGFLDALEEAAAEVWSED